jgi:hypothetical protein
MGFSGTLQFFPVTLIPVFPYRSHVEGNTNTAVPLMSLVCDHVVDHVFHPAYPFPSSSFGQQLIQFFNDGKSSRWLRT